MRTKACVCHHALKCLYCILKVGKKREKTKMVLIIIKKYTHFTQETNQTICREKKILETRRQFYLIYLLIWSCAVKLKRKGKRLSCTVSLSLKGHSNTGVCVCKVFPLAPSTVYSMCFSGSGLTESDFQEKGKKGKEQNMDSFLKPQPHQFPVIYI